MGRFWRTERFEGKFGFALQDSDDPLLFGMEYDEDNWDDDDELHFVMDKDATREALKALNEAYDVLNVPRDKRIYYVTSDDMLWRVYDEMWNYAYEPCGEDESHTVDANGNHVKPRGDRYDLALCRVALGIAIYSEAVCGNHWLDADC